MILKDALENLALNGNSTRLPIQVVILEVTLAELFLIHVVPEAVQLVQAIFIDHLASKSQLLVLIVINDESTSNFSDLIELGTVFDSNQLPNALDSKVILKLKLALLVQLTEIELTGLQILEQEITVGSPLEKSTQRLIEHLLYNLKFIFGSLLKVVLVNAPILELHFQHLEVRPLLLVQLPAVPNEVDHQAEGKRVTVDKYLVIDHLQFVSSREHGL